MTADVIVLGAGIIGVSTAIHLARRGKSVVLVDRRNPGEETSYGNAGLIQREGVAPYGFPRDFAVLLRYALNNRVDAFYHVRAMPKVAPFLLRYWWHSDAERHKLIAKAYAPLIEHSICEHADLIEAAGASHLIRKDGWMEVFRTPAALDAELDAARKKQAEYGLAFDALDKAELARREPHLNGDFAGGLTWRDPWSVLDPLALTQAYVALFEKLGGRFIPGDAGTLSPVANGWTVTTREGPVQGEDVVVALGPWSDTVTAPLGYRYLVGVKRGYHMHYGARDGAKLNNWLMDAERGYLLAPMNQGIRLTTGAEFALRDAPKTPVQLTRAEAIARKVFPLGERLDKEPWMGARPCTSDMMPVIGKAPRHRGLWFAFGHAHHGLTLGPITGRVLAETMTGEKPVIDISPYRPERFRA
ncbi:FAD-dependent oxidoreductase [Rhizobiales bacterium RZME27]|uniref:FAD-dependent oxidoreductase n=1 Tax=Endobacterium cereale TaxID=2663029 RepID=A0A6A8A9F6_9HYPH|nr:FAD-binding oxidoreductase [Endobacterium cereale]MEB2846794.1 FAD-binding oxidoreductase [Endobacterium cereale]MQY45431.1 FAD-dependent oxidoreductase [Endobacterium cereale]